MGIVLLSLRPCVHRVYGGWCFQWLFRSSDLQLPASMFYYCSEGQCPTRPASRASHLQLQQSGQKAMIFLNIKKSDERNQSCSKLNMKLSLRRVSVSTVIHSKHFHEKQTLLRLVHLLAGRVKEHQTPGLAEPSSWT